MREILTDFITGLPKAELHLHIEGTLTPGLKRQFADRNKMTLGDKSFAALKIDPATASPEAQAAFHINQYKMFLDLYYEGVKVLQTAEDFYELTFAYLRSCKTNNIRYCEISFDPQAHTNRGVAMGTVMEGLCAAQRDGEREFGVHSNLIMCINRDLPADSAMAMLEAARPYRQQIWAWARSKSRRATRRSSSRRPTTARAPRATG